MGVKISASLMCADLLNVSSQIATLCKEQVDYIHYDIIDGTFAHNITLGIGLFNQIRNKFDVRMDVHLLVNNPDVLIDQLTLLPGDIVTTHIESDTNHLKLSEKMHKMGVKYGIAINPETPLESIYPFCEYIDVALVMMIAPGFAGAPIHDNAMERLTEMKQYLIKKGHPVLLEADGHVSFDLIPQLIRNGAEILVAGSTSIFKNDDSIGNNVRKMKKIICES